MIARPIKTDGYAAICHVRFSSRFCLSACGTKAQVSLLVDSTHSDYGQA